MRLSILDYCTFAITRAQREERSRNNQADAYRCGTVAAKKLYQPLHSIEPRMA